MSGVRAILRFDRTVADLDRTEAFYRDGLGFVREAPPEPLPGSEQDVLGLAGRDCRRLRLRLGAQRVTFLAVDPPGAPYPSGAVAADPLFQHLAISVRDMASAFARLGALAPTPVTRDGPQRLPPSSGDVSAYKFRDPDGHPLELIQFPGGPPARRWAQAPGLFLGIDHSAITITDLDDTMDFLTTALGLTVRERGLNRGLEQGRLDGLDHPVVDVVALTPPEPEPHVELLHYRQPPGRAGARGVGPADRASTRFVFSADDPPSLAEALSRRGFPARASADGRACYGKGPDGHGLLFLRRD